MKRKITFLLAALLLMSGLTWAQTITWTAADQGYENSQVIESVDFDDYVSATFDKGTNNNAPKYYNTGAAIRCYGGNYFTVSSDYLLTEIVFGFSSGEGSNAITADCGAYANGTWTGSANSVTFSIGGTTGHRRFATFTISYTESGTPAPTITVENNDELAYNATSGSFNFTVDNPVSGGSMTVSTEEEWISNPTIAGSAVNFTTTVNQAVAPREGVITLAYTYGEQTITKPVTITQAGNPNIVNNISDITAAGYYSVQGTIVAINNRGFIVGDGTGYVYYYYGDNFEYGDYDIGDMVKLFGPVVVYGKVYEFNSSTTVTYVEESNYVEEAPIVLSGVDMDAQVASSSTDQLSSYVQYEGTFSINGTHYNITNIVGAQTAKGSISYPIDTTGFSSLDGKKVVVTGYYVGVSSNQYYNTMIGSVVESTEPAITLTPNEINVGSEGGRFGVAVTLSNITFGAIPSFNIPVWDEFYEWIHFEEVNLQELDSICFTLDPNTTDTQRSFYFELRIIPDLTHPSQVYSNRVTVTQEAYVAPTYAELPFEFDGGKADIESTDGLYQEGLDSDYSSSPKLKFNTAGDYVLLQFQEVPGTLTFDIKGNGSGSNPWEGVFKLMVSNDGSTFVEKAVYETGDLTSTKTTMTIDDLASEVRYIKWIYTTKTLGNVALGNIHLYEFGGGPVTEYDLTIEPFENLEIFTFLGGDENNPFEGAGTIQVTVGDQVMLSITANEGYEIQ